jgi:V8-like Glu-specific endopeptidase
VIGVDERVRVFETDLRPWRMVCALKIRGGLGSAIGTGWLVGAKTVLTAGHCVNHPMIGGWAASIEVVPGQNGADRPFGSVRSTSFHSVNRWIEDRDPDFDYGVIHLAEDLGAQLGWFGLKVADADELTNALVNVSGYPGDRGAGAEQYHHRNRVVQVTGRRVFYEVDTAAGQSGAPVWTYDDADATMERPLAVGIHAYGVDGGARVQANSAPRIIPEAFDQIQAWIAADDAPGGG